MNKFNCLCDADLSYTEITTHHLSTIIREHLHTKVRSVVGKHKDNCYTTYKKKKKKKTVNKNEFKIMSIFSNEFVPKFRTL